jgi:hypothetical protein
MYCSYSSVISASPTISILQMIRMLRMLQLLENPLRRYRENASAVDAARAQRSGYMRLLARASEGAVSRASERERIQSKKTQQHSEDLTLQFPYCYRQLFIRMPTHRCFYFPLGLRTHVSLPPPPAPSQASRMSLYAIRVLELRSLLILSRRAWDPSNLLIIGRFVILASSNSQLTK